MSHRSPAGATRPGSSASTSEPAAQRHRAPDRPPGRCAPGRRGRRPGAGAAGARRGLEPQLVAGRPTAHRAGGRGADDHRHDGEHASSRPASRRPRRASRSAGPAMTADRDLQRRAVVEHGDEPVGGRSSARRARSRRARPRRRARPDAARRRGVPTRRPRRRTWPIAVAATSQQHDRQLDEQQRRARPDDVRRGAEQRPGLDHPGDVQRRQQQRAEVVGGGAQRERRPPGRAAAARGRRRTPPPR